jgi:hypothetical protein
MQGAIAMHSFFDAIMSGVTKVPEPASAVGVNGG